MATQPIGLTKVKVLEHKHFWEVKEPRTSDRGVHFREHVPRDGRWRFNGDFERPTFTPSINNSSGGRLAGDGETFIPLERNHYIITDGRIQYCDDCTHEFARQTLDLICFNEAEVACHKENVP